MNCPYENNLCNKGMGFNQRTEICHKETYPECWKYKQVSIRLNEFYKVNNIGGLIRKVEDLE